MDQPGAVHEAHKLGGWGGGVHGWVMAATSAHMPTLTIGDLPKDMHDDISCIGGRVSDVGEGTGVIWPRIRGEFSRFGFSPRVAEETRPTSFFRRQKACMWSGWARVR